MIITTGVPNSHVVCRQELRTFFQDKDVTNLYLLAIDQMQKIPQQDLTSWFQVAAIHGRPFIPYDNVGTKGSFGGYCTHSSILFPPWHRPYVALFEQSVAKHVHEIAHEYKNHADRSRYIKAAERFRVPYWDWAHEATLPDIVGNDETVSVHLPDGTHRKIRNPLYGYNFNPVYSDFGDGLPDEKTWESWQSTVRYPTSKDDKAKSVPALMQTTLKNNRLTLRDRTYNLLTQVKDFHAFSHDAFAGDDQKPGWYDSLEAIHGQIHGLAGRNGHMGVVDYAAFDPVFWMHHANVDRIFAIWQGLNPDSYVTPLKSEAGTFTRKPGEIENAESPLTPFRRTKDKFWDPNGVRDTRVFNYTYPELEKWDSLSKKEKSVRLHQEVNRLYGKTAPVSAVAPSVFKGLAAPAAGIVGAAATGLAGHPVGVAAAGTVVAATGTAIAATETVTGVVTGALTGALTGLAGQPVGKVAGSGNTTSTTSDSPFEITTAKLADNHWHNTATTEDDKPHYHEWIANIVVEKYAVKSTFFVHIFLGDFSSDSNKWGIDPNLVGSHVVFANNANFTGCERCRDAYEQHKLVTGTIPLTGCLGARLGNVAELEPEQIIPYLQKNLHWRIQRHDNTPIEAKDVPGLKISVGHALVEIPASAENFATWGDIQMHSGATTGRLGGA